MNYLLAGFAPEQNMFFVFCHCHLSFWSFVIFLSFGFAVFFECNFFLSFGVVNFLSHAHACEFVNVLFCGVL